MPLEKLALLCRFKLWARFRPSRHPSFYLSHSQFGEDMAVRALVGDRRSGTYVDIGAHHPVYCSNTYHFYCKGWRGLNVDAQPGSMEAFRVLRPGDINVEVAVGPTSGERLVFHRFDAPTLNTFDAAAAQEHVRTSRARLLGTDELVVKSLAEILDQYLPNRQIDLLSIDVEGMDEPILRSNDWSRYRPTVLIFERQSSSLRDLAADPLLEYLQNLNYRLEGKCGHSVVMVEASTPASVS